MNKLFLIFILFAFTNTFAQITTTSDQLFGGTRPVEKANFHDFGLITVATQYEFIVSNSNKLPITIKTTEIPDGFDVVVVDKIIKPNSVGKIIIKVLPEKFSQKGEFEKNIKVVSEYETLGEKITKDIVFIVKGKIN